MYSMSTEQMNDSFVGLNLQSEKAAGANVLHVMK